MILQIDMCVRVCIRTGMPICTQIQEYAYTLTYHNTSLIKHEEFMKVVFGIEAKFTEAKIKFLGNGDRIYPVCPGLHLYQNVSLS